MSERANGILERTENPITCAAAALMKATRAGMYKSRWWQLKKARAFDNKGRARKNGRLAPARNNGMKRSNASGFFFQEKEKENGEISVQWLMEFSLKKVCAKLLSLGARIVDDCERIGKLRWECCEIILKGAILVLRMRCTKFEMN